MMIEINASQIKAFLRCSRLWAFQYLAGIASVGDAVAFGTAVHEHCESYLRNGTIPAIPGRPWMVRKANGHAKTLYPAIVASKGLAFCPPPETPGMRIEMPWRVEDIAAGVAFKGTMDFFLPESSNWEVQIESVIVEGETGREPVTKALPLVGDHKTTAGARFALTAGDLPTDVQCLMYAWAEFQHNPQATHVKCRWIYYPKSQHDSQGWAVDIVVERERTERAFDTEIRPAARAIVAAANRAGMNVVDPRKLPDGYPKDSRAAKLHVLNQFPYAGNTDDRCEKFGGCWFRGYCFNFDLQNSERTGDHLGTCGDECTEGACANRTTEVLPTIEAAPNLRPGEPASNQSQEGTSPMFTPNLDPTHVASLHARAAAGGITPGWQFYPAPDGDYLYNVPVAGDRAVHISEYFASYAPQAPAVNPPRPPAPPAASQAPASAPTAPIPGAPPPAAPGAPAQAPAAPTTAPGKPGAGATDEQNALFAEAVSQNLIPAGRPGKKPAVYKLRAILAWKWTLDMFNTWEESEKAKGADSQFNARMAEFGLNAAPPAQAPAAPVAPSAPAQAPAATAPQAPAAPSAPAQAPAAPKPGKTPKANTASDANGGFILAINALADSRGSVLDFNRDILPQLNARIAATPITDDRGNVQTFTTYDAVPFGRGVPIVNAALVEFVATIPAGTIVTLDSRTPAGSACVDTLRQRAAFVLQGY